MNVVVLAVVVLVFGIITANNWHYGSNNSNKIVTIEPDPWPANIATVCITFYLIARCYSIAPVP
jgi:hypothetical protein